MHHRLVLGSGRWSPSISNPGLLSSKDNERENGELGMFLRSLRMLRSVGTLAFVLNAQLAEAAYSFAGSNLYYAAGLYPQDRDTLLG